MTLIEHGATVDMPAPGKEHRGQTALHIAAGRGPLGLVSTLIGCGADPSRGTADGTLPVEGVSSWYTRDTELARRACTHRAHAPRHMHCANSRAHAHTRTCTCTCMCMHVRGACVQVRGLLLETLWQRALCAGWLIKLGTERKIWRKRFAVLLAEPTLQLRYYSDAQLSDCRGKLCLTHTSSRISSPAFAPAPTPWPQSQHYPYLQFKTSTSQPASHCSPGPHCGFSRAFYLPPPTSHLPTPYSLSLLPAPCHHPQHDPSVHAGKLDLRGLRAPPQSPSHYPGVPTAFSFDVLTPEQSFVLCAHTEPELQVWLRQLASLVHHRADGASLTYGGLSAAVAETSASSRRTTDLSRSSSLRDSSIGPAAPALHLPGATLSRPPRFPGAGAPSAAADEGS